MDNSIIPIIKELERVYDALSIKFDLKFSRPIITIQTKGRSKQTNGWYWDKKWQMNKEEIGEINICAEDLNKDPIEILIHEMVHYSNSCEKKEDCNDAGYHNKVFKVRAENYGLTVNKNGRHGWGLTSLSENLTKIITEIKVDNKVFELYRKEHFKIVAPTKMKKYSCGCTIVRCATELKAKCLKCNQDFILKEDINE